MKKLILFLAFIHFCCQNKHEQKPLTKSLKKEKSVSEIIANLNENDTLYKLDLSHKNLDSLPDLSNYKIIELNLSHNNLDTIPINKLPLTLKKLICSNNKLTYFLSRNYKNCSIPELKPFHNSELNLEEIDLSNNQLKMVSIKVLSLQKNKILPKKIILANNNLDNLDINDNIRYLDVSNNPNLKNEVYFAIEKIDTLLQNNPKKLKTIRIQKPLEPIICN